jgi:toxin ParE1/3/4
MSRLGLSPLAEQDLIEIGTYIARRSGSRESARRFLQKIVALCERLARYPDLGQLRTDLATGKYRSFSIGDYVIYYRPAVDGIRVARILHAARDQDALL